MKFKNILSLLLIVSTVTISCKDNHQKQEETNNPSQKSIEKENTKDSTIVEKNNASKKTETFEYVCFTNNDDKSKRIWVEFSKNGKANRIKYEGQNEPILLEHTKEDYVEGGVHPTIKNYYNEIYDGKINGQYILTHSGVWDYVKYIRGKDGKEFNYTIDHDADPYSSKPCF